MESVGGVNGVRDIAIAEVDAMLFIFSERGSARCGAVGFGAAMLRVVVRAWLREFPDFVHVRN